MGLKKDDLISRSAAIGCLGNSPEQMCMPWSEVERMLRELPAVDAAPVVRCRDCKHCFSCENDPMTPYDGETDWYCAEFDVDWHVLTLDPNRFYCANGERREDEND